MAAPWSRIKAEWLKGNVTQQQLAEKYHLSVKTIQNRAYKEGWKKEKGKIREKVEEETRARVVRARVNQLQKLIDASEALVDGLAQMAERIQKTPSLLLDKNETLKNAESFAKALQTAVTTQRDLLKLPTLDQDMARKAEAQRKREAKAKLEFEREKWEASRKEAAETDQEVWEIVAPEGAVVDG